MYRDHTDTLRVGSPAPAFDLPTAEGQRITSDTFRQPLLLLFFLRGTWCPNCKKLMRRLADDHDQFRSMGVDLALIAAQRMGGITGARRFVEDNRYPFPLLFDEKRRVVREWGVYRPIGIDALHIAHPAVFLIDGERIIRWIAVSPNQYTRPSTPELIAAIEGVRRADPVRP
jgi:peroxiredoxin Q/BCP